MESPNVINIQFQIPQSEYDKMRVFIQDTIALEMKKHYEAITAPPKKLTRKETAVMLRISLPTLGTYDEQGLIKSERIGRRVLYDLAEVQRFLKRPR